MTAALATKRLEGAFLLRMVWSIFLIVFTSVHPTPGRHQQGIRRQGGQIIQ